MPQWDALISNAAAARCVWWPAWAATSAILPHNFSRLLQVRQAFTADVSKGHTLVVADYGQLELRVLAHMANCKSMISAFKQGGDFHSRTALGMYDHIQDAIKAGACCAAALCTAPLQMLLSGGTWGC